MGILGFRIGKEGLGEASPSARSLYTEPPQRGQCSTEVMEFRFTGVGLLHGPETLRAQVSSLMEVQGAGADEGGDAEGLRDGTRLATPPYPSNCAHPQAPSPAQKYWVGAVCGGWGGKGRRQAGRWRGLDGEQSEGGVVCVVHLLLKPDMLKGRSLLVARLQASQVVGLIHWPWLGCLCAFISRFRLVLYPSRRW